MTDGAPPKQRRSPRSAGERDLPIIGANVGAHRRGRRLSLAALARESGVSGSMLGQVELGQSVPTVTVLEDRTCPRRRDRRPRQGAEIGGYVMRIGLVGGITRNDPEYIDLARAEGHVLETHSGNVHGRGAEELRRLIDRVDLVVVLTDVNSHGGVLLARKLANRSGRGALLLRRLGRSRFQLLLEALRLRGERARSELGHTARTA